MKRILSIDSDPAFEAEVRRRMEQLQVSASSAADGPEGLDLAKSNPHAKKAAGLQRERCLCCGKMDYP